MVDASRARTPQPGQDYAHPHTSTDPQALASDKTVAPGTQPPTGGLTGDDEADYLTDWQRRERMLAEGNTMVPWPK